MSTLPALLRLEGFGVAVGDRVLVSGVDLELRAGERYALVGQSGSGKTVTALGLLRLLPGLRSRGGAWFDGRDLVRCSESEMRAVRGGSIGLIFQEPMSALNPLLAVGAQVAESLRLHEGLGRRAAAARAIELLERMGLREPARAAAALPHQLSGGQRQRCMIAMALACSPRLLLADEPTTALDPGVRAQILELLASVQRERGLAMLLISHDLRLVRDWAGRVGIMHEGRLIEQGPTPEIFDRPRHEHTRALLAARPRRDLDAVAADAPLRLRVDGLRVEVPGPRRLFRRTRRTLVDAASLELRAGETLGIVGESGSGKTTLAMALLGLQPVAAGRVRLDGRELLSPADWRAARRRLQVVFQDPFSSLSPRMTVEDIVGEGLRIHQPGMAAAARRDRAAAALDELGLDPAMLPRRPHEFSGGQRQRIALARALVLDPEVLVLDEPTSALDVFAQAQILALLGRLQRSRGMAYVFISHDLEVVGAMAHRIAVMRDGRIVAAGEALEVLAGAPPGIHQRPGSGGVPDAAPGPGAASVGRSRPDGSAS